MEEVRPREDATRPVKVSVVITTYNRPDYIRENLEALKRNARPHIQVAPIIIDNDTKKNASEVDQHADAARVIHFGKGGELTAAINKGIQEALDDPETDYVLYLNDDTYLHDDALTALVQAGQNHGRGLFTTLQLTYDPPIQFDQGAFEHIQASEQFIQDAVLERPQANVYPLPTILGAAMFASRETFEHIGPFDPALSLYGADDDYSKRAKYLGYDLYLVPGARMYHAHGRFMYTPENDYDAWLLRWKSKQTSRYLLMLKDPVHSLPRNYIRLARVFVADGMRLTIKLWGTGLIHCLKTYAWLVLAAPRIRRARREHFDPSRRLKPRESS